MPLIEVQNLCKEYSRRQVLKDITFSVQNGEICVLVGPNGAGKTTLLRILDLLEDPTTGRILFDGKEIDYLSKDKVTLRRRIAMVFQQTVLFNMNVFDNVAYGLTVRDENKRSVEQKVKTALELVQLRNFESKNALTLSGGEAQRVALAQALVTEPELLLLDEPTANLDPKSASVIEETVSRVNREHGTTIVMATHNIFQAKNITQKVALLIGGRLVDIGRPEEVFERAVMEMSSFARLENIFSGDASVTDEGNSIINVGNDVKIEAASALSGKVTVHVRPEDIILSKRSMSSSARNMFRGSIVEVTDLGSIVKLRIDAGKEFIVQITKRSFVEMKLNLSSKVYLTFKASSVHRV